MRRLSIPALIVLLFMGCSGCEGPQTSNQQTSNQQTSIPSAAAAVGFVASINGSSGFDFLIIPSAPGGTFSLPLGINDQGQIVGLVKGTNNGFLYSDGTFSTISYPGAEVTAPSGINNAGLIVGLYANPSGPSLQAFTFQGGTFNTFEVPGSTENVAYGVNNLGQIVGAYVAPNASFPVATNAFLNTNGVFTTFTVPGTQVTNFVGINDHQQIVGSFVDKGRISNPFLYENGVMTPLNIPNALSAGAQSINNAGQIVGNYIVGDDIEGPGLTSHAYLYNSGTFTNIEFPGIPDKIIDVSTTVTGINDRGQIIGHASFTCLGAALKLPAHCLIEKYVHSLPSSPLASL